MVQSNEEGISKVVEADGKYAYLMEDSTIQYIIERNCKVTQIGGTLDNKARSYIIDYSFVNNTIIDFLVEKHNNLKIP